MQHWLKFKQFSSFRRTTPNFSMLAYKVNILFKCIWRLRNIQRQCSFYRILNVVIMQNCWTHITVMNATWLNLKHFLFGVRTLQTSSFLHYSLGYTLCLLFKCILGVEKHRKLKISHSYEPRYDQQSSVLSAYYATFRKKILLEKKRS